MKLLGIETSCDETAAAVVAGGRKILSNVVASQVEVHARYGGIVPEVASRQHLLSILPVVKRAMEEAGVGWGELGGIAATIGPGLPGSLLVGVNLAKALAYAHHLPLYGVNHLEAHLYALWLEGKEPPLPALSLVVSGGHTEMALMRGHGDILSLGRTRDDAAGEAFDKAARRLGLGYPGGPAIERAVSGAGALAPPAPLPRSYLPGSYDFSFSGLKTALWRLMGEGGYSTTQLAAGFQEAVAEVLVAKALKAAQEYGARSIAIAGGVAANRHLRELLLSRSPLPVLFPSPALCTDNAAMVAACAHFHPQPGGWDLSIAPNLRLGTKPG